MTSRGFCVTASASACLCVRQWTPWSDVYANNIKADGLVFQQAAQQGMQRVVYASSCHSQHGKSLATTHESLDAAWGRHVGQVHRLTDPAWPSSLYGAAKALGEHLGRYYALNHGLQCVATRIGWLVPGDDPSNEADTGGASAEAFMRALYLSHRDAAHIFDAALNVDLSHCGGFGLVYASSNNGRSMLDRASSERLLGYASVDDAEKFFDVDS